MYFGKKEPYSESGWLRSLIMLIKWKVYPLQFIWVSSYYKFKHTKHWATDKSLTSYLDYHPFKDVLTLNNANSFKNTCTPHQFSFLFYLARLCAEIMAPGFGEVFCDGYVVGKTCDFQCNQGYELIGSKDRRCQTDGTWSGPETKCQRKCLLLSYNDLLFVFIEMQMTQREILRLLVCKIFFSKELSDTTSPTGRQVNVTM